MNDIKEMTAHSTSVGADEGQSLNESENSISDFLSNCKDNFGRRRSVWRS